MILLFGVVGGAWVVFLRGGGGDWERERWKMEDVGDGGAVGKGLLMGGNGGGGGDEGRRWLLGRGRSMGWEGGCDGGCSAEGGGYGVLGEGREERGGDGVAMEVEVERCGRRGGCGMCLNGWWFLEVWVSKLDGWMYVGKYVSRYRCLS